MLHRPARTAVSILGIAVGVLLIVFTVGLANGTIREQASREANVGAEIFFRASGSIGMSGSESFRLPVSMALDVLSVEGVRSAVAIGQHSVDAADNNTGKRLVDGVEFDEIFGDLGTADPGGTAVSRRGRRGYYRHCLAETEKAARRRHDSFIRAPI